MDVMLQRHCARYIYVIPNGLKELLSDISREVLRTNPEDVYTFIADYLDALMVTRENARVAARMVVYLTEMAQNATQFLMETNLTQEDIKEVLKAINKTFEKSLEDHTFIDKSEGEQEYNVVDKVLKELSVSPDSLDIAATIIQQAYRRFRERKREEDALLVGIIDWRVAARNALKLYRGSGASNEEAQRAATLIKAAYKGYYTRKMIHSYALRFKQADLTPCLSHSGVTQKSVKIDYDTVLPHVDFDDQGQIFGDQDTPPAETPTDPINKSENVEKAAEFDKSEQERKPSTVSEISRHVVDVILDIVCDKAEIASGPI